ncbi:hypothetical protein [Microbacterium mcarthurae (nom. nud.)]|uniref:Uncharacterized protein n=1 Tax=Microbacterium mcarthurae TaxID=3035918 RepID=A0ABW9GDZ3_9MICO
MDGSGFENSHRGQVRFWLWLVAGVVAVTGIVLAVIMQSWLPLLCIAGLAVPLLPVPADRR